MPAPYEPAFRLWRDCIAVLTSSSGACMQVGRDATAWSISVDYGEMDANGSGLRGVAGTLCAIRQQPFFDRAPSNSAWLLRVFVIAPPQEVPGREVMRMAWALDFADPTEPGGLYVERFERGAWETDLTHVLHHLRAAP